MKKTLLTICLGIAGLFAAEAQNKLGYINSNELLSIMPESIRNARQNFNLMLKD